MNISMKDEEVIEKYLSGLSTWTIAKLANTNQTRIRRILARNKIQTRTAAEFHASHKKSESARWTGYGEISGGMWSRIKLHARKRKIEFKLFIEDAWELFLKQNRKCIFSGEILFFALSDNDYAIGNWTASLDRIDSKKCYTIDNVQWINKDINLMKWFLKDEDFLEMCRLVAIYE